MNKQEPVRTCFCSQNNTYLKGSDGKGNLAKDCVVFCTFSFGKQNVIHLVKQLYYFALFSRTTPSLFLCNYLNEKAVPPMHKVNKCVSCRYLRENGHNERQTDRKMEGGG